MTHSGWIYVLSFAFLSVYLFTRFQWKTNKFPPELSIKPSKGYIGPGTEVPFDVTFAPVELSADTRFENLSCCVEGLSSPVTLSVTGSCVVASTSKEVGLIYFHTMMSTAVKKISTACIFAHRGFFIWWTVNMMHHTHCIVLSVLCGGWNPD